jgi:hypothetical protein
MADRALEIQRALVDVNTAAVNDIVAGVVGYRIHVVAAVLVAAGNVTVTVRGGAGVAVPVTMIAGTPLVLNECTAGWIRCLTGQALQVELGGAVAVGGTVVYRLVPDHVEL